MFKRLFVAAMLCVGLIAMLGTEEAKAWPRPYGGFGLTFGSVTCDSFWKAIGNPDINHARVECDLDIEQIQVQCMTNGGGVGGLGNPFYVDSGISGFQLLTDANLVGKGKAWSEIEFLDGDMFDALFCDEYVNDECTNYVFPPGICQNPNWSVISPDDGGSVHVIETDVILSGYATNKQGEFLSGIVGGSCTLIREDPDPLKWEYDCTECPVNMVDPDPINWFVECPQ